jgi:hypothetical protein
MSRSRKTEVKIDQTWDFFSPHRVRRVVVGFEQGSWSGEQMAVFNDGWSTHVEDIEKFARLYRPNY